MIVVMSKKIFFKIVSFCLILSVALMPTAAFAHISGINECPVQTKFEESFVEFEPDAIPIFIGLAAAAKYILGPTAVAKKAGGLTFVNASGWTVKFSAHSGNAVRATMTRAADGSVRLWENLIIRPGL